MVFLGINQDRYDSGVTLTDGHRILYAANEERFTRTKTQGGFPEMSLQAAFRETGVEPEDVTKICVAGLMTPPLPVRAFPSLHRIFFDPDIVSKRGITYQLVDLVETLTPLAHTREDSWLRKLCTSLLAPAVRRTLPRACRKKQLVFVEHHTAHAFAGWYLSGFDRGLCITGDGRGDGLSMTVSTCNEANVERVWVSSSLDSLGVFYQNITQAFGFLPCRHEGKLTGMAAHGSPEKVQVPSPFTINDGGLSYHGPMGLKAIAWAKRELVEKYKREDIAAWLQQILEANVLEIAKTWLQKTGHSNLVLSGGIFANVKLNQRLHELDEVEQLFVCPNMGDGGLSLGAICAHGGLDLQRVADVFFGDEFSDQQVVDALSERGVPFERCENIAETVASLLSQGNLVGRFDGRMEWGPRALGNRSVLSQTTDPTVVKRLNTKLQRNDFMPFAPALPDEDGEAFLTELDKGRHAAEFMTTCFQATPKMQNDHPAIVHVDGTVRPQLVRKDSNPQFYRILTAFRDITGSGVVLNTSFNIHEEPIVRTPEEAVRSFLDAELDYLAIKNFITSA